MPIDPKRVAQVQAQRGAAHTLENPSHPRYHQSEWFSLSGPPSFPPATASALEGLQVIVSTVLRSMPDMINVMVLLVIFMFIYAVIGMSMFGAVLPEYFGQLDTGPPAESPDPPPFPPPTLPADCVR